MWVSSDPKPHAMVFPYPYQGHITPMINLAIKLACNGFTVTYVQPEFLPVPYLGPGLDIRCATISDNFSPDFDRDANFTEYWESMILDFPARVDELIGSIRRSGEAAVLVADSLYTWTADIAMKHDLVNVSVWTEPAMVFTICYHMDLLVQNGHFPPDNSMGQDVIKYIPGVESISIKDLMSFVVAPDVVPVVAKLVIKAFQQVKNADFILCNTVQELEFNALSALNLHRPTFAIGPINFFSETGPSKSLRSESDCIDWLNSKPPASVLYISFGSIARVNEHEIKEIAHGLLLSRVNFIWIIRTDDVDTDPNMLFPAPFLDDVAGRGRVIPWCNQVAVLSHAAVGGFLTHCGWNSVVESVWSGVPMICYPFFVDQPTNRKLVVEDWRIGINLCDDGGKVERGEVVRKIDVLMNGEIKCVELRETMKKVSKTMRNALEKDGSSIRNFDRFLRDLKVRFLQKQTMDIEQ